MKAIYTIKADLKNPDGIGLTASKGIAGLEAAGVLHSVYSSATGNMNDIAWDLSATSHLLLDESWDTLVCWNHMALRQLDLAKGEDRASVVIRASTHPRNQQRVLRQECQTVGLQQEMVPDEVVQRCEAEFEKADIVLIPSAVVHKTMVENGVPEEKLFTIPHGVDLEQFQPPRVRPEGFNPLYVGPNWLRKGLIYGLLAWGRLRVAPTDEFLVAPLDSLPVEAKQARAMGRVTSDALLSLYRTCSCFVLPTLEEGQALALLEAAACGCPIITTEASGALEFLKPDHSVLLVPPRDVKALADAMDYLYQDPEAALRLGDNARRDVENWPWSRYGAGVVEACRRAHA